MKDLNMTDERNAIDAIQESLGDIKKNLRNIQKMNADAGRDGASNAAMKMRGKTIVLHAEMTEALQAFYPEFSGDVQARGAGQR